MKYRHASSERHVLVTSKTCERDKALLPVGASRLSAFPSASAIVAAGAENEARSDQHLQEAQTPPTAQPTMGAHYTVVRGLLGTYVRLALKPTVDGILTKW